MALAVGNTARSLFGLRRIAVNRALVGKWLQNQLCTSAKLSQTSESSGEKNTKIYEVRTYYVKPKAFGKEILFSNVFFFRQKSSQGSRTFDLRFIPLGWEMQPLCPSPAPSWKEFLFACLMTLTSTPSISCVSPTPRIIIALVFVQTVIEIISVTSNKRVSNNVLI